MFRGLKIIFFLWLLSMPCFAKKVTIKWKDVRGALKYEIRIMYQTEDKVVFRKKVPSKRTSFKVSLKPGYYYFRVRGIDRAKRPGKWSKDAAIVVTPETPVVVEPNDNKVVMYGENQQGIIVSWEPVKGAHKYLLEVGFESERVYSELTEETTVKFRDLGPGRYRWRIKAIVEAMGTIPGWLESRVGGLANGPPSEWRTLVVKPAPIPEEGLAKPKILFPKGAVLPPEDKRELSFYWEPVPGAVAYEVTLEPQIPLRLIRRLAHSKLPKPKTYRTSKSQIDIKLPKFKNYSWTVRALAAFNSRGKPRSLGPQSAAEFQLDSNASPYGMWPIDMKISFHSIPYHFHMVSPFTGYEELTNAMAFRLNAELDYWFSKHMGIGAFVDGSFFYMANLTVDRKEAGLSYNVKTRMGTFFKGWDFMARAGIQYREFFAPYDINQYADTFRMGILGPSLNLSVFKKFSEKFGVGMDVGYYYPMWGIMMPVGSGMTVGNSGRAPGHVINITGEGRSSNYAIKVFSHVMFSPTFGLGGGLGFNRRVLSYQVQGGTGEEDRHDEHVSLDSINIFLSLIFGLGG